MNMSPAVCAILVVSTLAACGGENQRVGPTAEASNSSAGNGASRTVSLGCAGGLRVKGAEVVSSGNDVSVAWSENDAASGETPTEYISYIVTVTSADGRKARQLAKKMYVTGEPPSQFIYDTTSIEQTNLPSDGGANPSDINDAELHFPDALEGIDSGWKAEGVVNIDGRDALTCSTY
ncbi:hypothetical protein [Dermacoccus sp. Tok2021]|uniref:hypothetical protein n=1 Tax=Dermacoccus sp. Tok2021 TaxID=2826873 RepID=UPI001CA72E27|nr:hypothetical protein [Dermacoccus sp. Tok2021]MBZ4497945.1 hypothetical protein [Dermacoccus sp. Tok2021]